MTIIIASGPFPVSPQEEKLNGYLLNLTPAQELTVFFGEPVRLPRGQRPQRRRACGPGSGTEALRRRGGSKPDEGDGFQQGDPPTVSSRFRWNLERIASPPVPPPFMSGKFSFLPATIAWYCRRIRIHCPASGQLFPFRMSPRLFRQYHEQDLPYPFTSPPRNHWRGPRLLQPNDRSLAVPGSRRGK